MSEHLSGKIQVASDLIPTNDNPKGWVSDSLYIKGGPQVFTDIAGLIAFHPFRMKRGMQATVTNWPDAGTSSNFLLTGDPNFMVDGANASVVTEDNFSNYWELQSQTTSSSSRVRQYAADGINGAAPTYPYTLVTETEWSNTYDPSKGHKWMRFRDDDVDENAPLGVYDNWTEPIPILSAFQSGDYIDKRFKREGLKTDYNATFSAPGSLTADEYYIIEEDDIQITGDLTLADIGQTDTNGSIVLTTGRTFKYVNDPGIIYDFEYGDATGVVRRTIKVPPRTLNGLPNNEPVGWEDTPPELPTTDQLWEISGQKSIYGQLKTDWLLKKIVEDPSYTRYSNSASPHPDTLCSTSESAIIGSDEDLRLEGAGWTSAYNEQVFIARRTDAGGGLYTNWIVEKISEESGEYVDRVFKLFDLNLDIDDPAIAAPVDRDPAREGWSDSPLVESPTQINYVSEARKFFDGTLKSAWSKPVPFTGKDVFTDTISADPTDNFKKDANDVTTPTTIRLTSRLYKGIEKLWEVFGLTMTYKWFKVYDGGIAISNPTEIVSTNPADDAYLETFTGSGTADAGGSSTIINDAAGDFITKGVTVGDKIWNISDGSYATVTNVNSAIQLTTTALEGGTLNLWSSGNVYSLQVDGYQKPNQVLVIKPGAIDGQASFRCEQYLTLSIGNIIDFADEISILDITDGKDAQNLSLRAGTRIVVYDSVNLVFAPATIEFSAYTSNIISPTFYFYRKDGGSWTKLFPGPFTGYTISGSSMIVNIATAALFASNSNTEEKTFAVALEDITDPTTAEFYDLLTVAKLGSSNVGTPGDSAYLTLLSNEAQIVVLNSTDGLPAAGEVAKATSRISVYYGEVKLDYNAADFTAVVDNTTQFEITDPADATGDAIISLKNLTWVNGVRSYIGTITINAAGIIMTKQFSLSSTIDAPGAVILDIDSDRGFEFTPTDKVNPKILSANLYDTALTGTQLIPVGMPYQYRWKVGAAAYTSYSTARTKSVSRADILSSGVVIVQVTKDAGVTVFRERSVIISDVVDGKAYRAWTDNDPLSGNLLTNQNPTTAFGGGTVVVGSVTWRLQSSSYWATNTPIWVQDAYEDFGQNPPAWAWTSPYRITGEKGDQGDQGNFIYPMFKASYYEKTTASSIAAFVALPPPGYLTKGSIVQLSGGEIYFYNGSGTTNPANYTTTEIKPDFGGGGSSSTLTQMKGAGTNYVDWFALPPSGEVIWKTERLFKGQGVTFNSGYPEYSPTPTSPFNSDGSAIGSFWATPVRISTVDGRSISGSTGNNGWSPVFSVVNGNGGVGKVLQLVNWVGGTGSPPTIDVPNSYVGASALGPIAAAVNIQGPAGSPSVFGSSAIVFYKKLNSVLVEGSGNIWNNGANGNSWADSSTYSEFTNWTNNTGYNLYVRVDGEAAAYNATIDGSAKFELKTQVGFDVPQLEVDFKRYSANILPNVFRLHDYVLVPNGSTLTVTTTIRAILNAPNYLWQRCGIKIAIIS